VPGSDYRPQLATLVKEPPSGDEWIHEVKFDGYRIGCRIRRGRVALYSRNGKEWTAQFPEIVEAATALPTTDALIDGEVCMVLPDGRTSFQALQQAFAAERSRDSLTYFVFDLLRVDGESLDQLPLEQRKTRLGKLAGRRQNKARIRYSAHVVGNGDTFYEEACRHGLEGIISKRRDQPYHSGRHRDWLKVKCTLGQELVIGGFTDPEGSRQGIGALLLGHYDRDGRLIFSGKVGTGFTHALALQLRRTLERLEQPASPFATPPVGVGRNVHWVKPKLVAEIEFTEWTSDGKIRHPSFKGLRADKKAREVIREQPAPAAAASATSKRPAAPGAAEPTRVRPRSGR
jgi:bifunctional non-homologous end joining protein LigD